MSEANRVLVVGDIHGGLRAFQELLKDINPEESDQFIFLGDLVDGWSDSAKVIDFLMGFRFKHKCIFIRGNHDEWCEEWLRTGVPNGIWTQHGGLSTINDYHAIADKEREQHLDFFREMVDYHIDDENRLFVHAGFTSMHGPHKEHYRSNFNWDRTLWESARAANELGAAHKDYPERLKLFKEIYIGHTPVSRLGFDHPIKRSNVWNVDTGAAFKGSLSILDANSGDYWCSSPVCDLYPGEKGRNA